MAGEGRALFLLVFAAAAGRGGAHSPTGPPGARLYGKQPRQQKHTCNQHILEFPRLQKRTSKAGAHGTTQFETRMCGFSVATHEGREPATTWEKRNSQRYVAVAFSSREGSTAEGINVEKTQEKGGRKPASSCFLILQNRGQTRHDMCFYARKAWGSVAVWAISSIYLNSEPQAFHKPNDRTIPGFC